MPKKNDLRKQVFTIPNLLSCLRLLMVPLFVWTFLVKQSGGWTALILAASGLTDILDGRIARRFNSVSDVGKILDPIADKVTQGAILICLLSRFPAMWLPLITLLLMTVVVGVTGIMLIRKTHSVDGAKFQGKVVTVLLYLLVLVHLVWDSIPSGLSIFLIVLTTLIMLLALWLYAAQNLARLKRLEDQAPRSHTP